MNDLPLQRILYVDDEDDIRAIAEVALEAVGGFTLCLCDGAEAALAQAEAFAPDLLLLDVMMPGQDGPHTLEALRRLPGLAQVPAVFMTAKTQPKEIETLMAHGALAVLTKPFDPMALAEQLREIWRQGHA